MNTEFPVKNISDLIPQKEPFVMVDTLMNFTEDSLVSHFTVASDNLFVENGYFISPGLVENMAQSVALHTGFAYFLKGEDAPTGYIGSVKKVTIVKLPEVAETIITKVRILHEFMGVTMVEVNVYNQDGEELASGEMKTVIAANE